VAVHIITGGADEEMARDGDTKSVKAERYARTDEYLTILRLEWTAAQPFDHQGKFYDVKQAYSAIKPDNLPIFFGGSSEEAIEVSGRHADVYALWGETLEAVQDTVRQVRRSAARYGRDSGFSLSLRPVIADTEEAAWKRAAEIEEQVRENRLAAGLPVSGHRPPNSGSQRLLDTASANRRDTRLWTGVAALTGAAGNSTGLVGTPEQVADAMLDYYDIGIDHFLIRGFDPLGDSVLYGRELLPVVRRKVAERSRADLALAG
jgi:alkanesulfonate monooxygenase